MDPNSDHITVQGKPITYRQHVYLMLNKPKGVVCATEDSKHKTVIDLVPEEWKRRGLFPAGRLDIDTTGFVLLTDDGDFAHRMLSPKKHVAKTYRAKLRNPLQMEAPALFAEGICLLDGTSCLPAKLTVLEAVEQPVVEVVLVEGKFHQIKRMFHAIGNEVLELCRVKIGEVKLDAALPEGSCRPLTEYEQTMIFRRFD